MAQLARDSGLKSRATWRMSGSSPSGFSREVASQLTDLVEEGEGSQRDGHGFLSYGLRYALYGR